MILKRTRRIGLFWLLLCCGISVLWGYLLERASPDGMIDFKGTFYSARCLLQHNDPYKDGEPLRAYLAEQNNRPLPSPVLRQVLSQDIYLPTTSIFIAPFAMLPWGPAHLLWMILSREPPPCRTPDVDSRG